jgi:hypothetical protein
MFRKLYLAGASPPRLPGAGPGLALHLKRTQQPINTALKENQHGH